MGEIYKNLSLEKLENEEWRDIVSYENYQVSSLGRVKSLNYNHTKQEKILKQAKMKDGYLLVNLWKDGKSKTCTVHRLVAIAFIPNPNGYRCVNHKDENPSNNIVSNLEWCTHQYNNTYGTCIQRRVAHTDYKAIVEKRKIDYKARTAHTDYKARTAKMDYQSIGKKNAEKLTNRQDQSKQVYQYDKNGELVAIWESTMECGRNGYNFGAVSQCCRNCFNREGNNVYKGYIWSYTEL